jgi:hypothetical protein
MRVRHHRQVQPSGAIRDRSLPMIEPAPGRSSRRTAGLIEQMLGQHTAYIEFGAARTE